MNEPRGSFARAAPIGKDALGRADLVRLVFGDPGFDVDAAARLLGFERLEPLPAEDLPPRRGPPPVRTSEATEEPVSAPGEAGAGAPLVRAIGPEVKLEPDPPPAFLAEAEPPSRLGARADFVAPATAPLASAGRLAVALRRLLILPAPGAQIDAVRLVRELSRCRALRRLPRKTRPAWTPRLTVYWDQATALEPCADDQRRVVAWLARARGTLGLDLAVLGASGGARWFRARQGSRPRFDERQALPAPPDASTTVLALSDLGFAHGGGAREPFWEAMASQALRAGAKPRALVLCPADRWRRGARLWRALEWERPRPIAGSHAFSSGVRGGRSAPRAARVDRLLTLLAPAIRIEPALLRAARRLLGTGADLGTELDAWMDGRVASRSPLAATLDTGAARALKAQFAELPREVRNRVRALLRDHHSGLAPVILDEELQAFPDADAMAEGAKGFASYASTLASRVPGPGEHSYLLRLEARREPEDWRLEPYQATWALGFRRSDLKGFTRPLPEGLLPEHVDWALQGGMPVRSVRLWQRGPRVWLLPIASPSDPLPDGPGSHVAELPYRHDELLVAWIASSGERQSTYVRAGEAAVQLPFALAPGAATRAIVASGIGHVELVLEERPEWADALERDAVGLWLHSAVGRAEDRRVATPAAQRLSWPTWARALERDERGLLAVLHLGQGVTTRLRWIPPGRFRMGSPEDENGRDEDEGPQHEVTITRGFWLGEAPCTQAEWEAVMGENPSHFKGTERPVEQVSWDDCQEFCRRLASARPAFVARLPTEAEWEYACRAGTESAYSDGSACTEPEGNDAALDAFGWFDANSGEETHAVKQKRPNAWGLYDVHGNVWEWCQDWSAPYPKQQQVDPSGPANGHGRVDRGGSFFARARYCRSAYRWWHPAEQDQDLGFRLAAGQPVSSGAEPGDASAGAEPRAERPEARRPKSQRDKNRKGPPR